MTNRRCLINGPSRKHYVSGRHWIVASFLSLSGSGLMAEEQESVSASTSRPVQLPELLITAPVQNPGGTSESGAGEYIFDQSYIERFGSADGGLENILKLVPGIQFGESSQSVEGLTDLRPESISISGGRFYENNFVLDGLSNSNRLDPASDSSSSSVSDIGGHEQSLFIDADLIGELKVYDSNVPAAYGGFTGGVVENVGQPGVLVASRKAS